MRAKIVQHKDISTVMLVAIGAVLAYALFGVFVLHQQEQKQAAAQHAMPVAANL
jgi:hypothetical protein